MMMRFLFYQTYINLLQKQIIMLKYIFFLFIIIFTRVTINAQSAPFIGQISMFGGNFAPRGWAFCNGQLFSISQNTALFSLIGTIYGGDGRTTFALPDL